MRSLVALAAVFVSWIMIDLVMSSMSALLVGIASRVTVVGVVASALACIPLVRRDAQRSPKELEENRAVAEQLTDLLQIKKP